MVQIINKEKVDYLIHHGWIEEWTGNCYKYNNPDYNRFAEYELEEAFEIQLGLEND